jgi:two-component system, NarL family, nitrate/nitrite response regulator NarL
MRRVRVVIADRHPVVVQGLSNLLGAERDFKIVARCSDGASCTEAIRNLAPDIAVLDLSMPDMSGVEVLATATAESLPTRFVFFLASVEDRDLAALAAAGAYSVILKDQEPEILVQTLRQVAAGARQLPLPSSEEAVSRVKTAMTEKDLAALTERERQIMRLVSKGLSNKEIGRRLNVSAGTIKVHLHHIFQKLDISNRTSLAALAILQNELIEPPAENRVPVNGKR